MTDFITNYKDIVIGVQTGTDYTDLTRYMTDFDLALDNQIESDFLAGRKTQWAVPTGSMLTAALNGYVLQDETPKFSDIFNSEDAALFMIYYTTAKRAFVFNAFVNTNGITRKGGVQAMDQPLMVTGGDWTRTLDTGDTPALSGVDLNSRHYAFAYLTAPLTGNVAIEAGASGSTSAVSDLEFTTSTSTPSIHFAQLTAGTNQDVVLDAANQADKANILWGVAEVRD